MKKYQNKGRQRSSAGDKELDRIIVPVGRKAEDVADGKYESNSDGDDFLVEIG